MFADWKNDVAHVKKSFGELGKNYPKMLQAYGALDAAASEGNVLDAKTRELIALAVADTPPKRSKPAQRKKRSPPHLLCLSR